MKQAALFFVFSFLLGITAKAQVPHPPALLGYWQNWDDPSSPYIPITQIDSRYNIIAVAFAIPQAGTDYNIQLVPDQGTTAAFISQIQSLKAQGKKVIVSIGGATAPIVLDNVNERDVFVNSVTAIINTFGFEGIDIDFEGGSLSVSGGTITAPTDAKIIHFIAAIKQIMSNYYATDNKHLFLSMAPETAYVQGGMSAYSGVWGGYLPVIHALRDSIDILNVQLYNSGTMYGIDGNIYTQGTADFIVAMTEATIQGFTTNGGTFVGLPSHKIGIGLPACSKSAGGGYTDTATVKAAIDYLRGTGPKPGNYTLAQAGGYPNLRGMMTWSINWDALSNCESSYEFAANFARIFVPPTSTDNLFSSPSLFDIYPNPSTKWITIHASTFENSNKEQIAQIYDLQGKMVLMQTVDKDNATISIAHLHTGVYVIKVADQLGKFIKQ